MNNWPGRRVEDDRSLSWCQSDRLYWVLRLKRIYPRAAYYHIISRSGDLQQQSSEPWPQARPRPDDGLTTGCRLDQLTPHRRDYPWNTDCTVTAVNYFRTRDNFPSLPETQSWHEARTQALLRPLAGDPSQRLDPGESSYIIHDRSGRWNMWIIVLMSGYDGLFNAGTLLTWHIKVAFVSKYTLTCI